MANLPVPDRLSPCSTISAKYPRKIVDHSRDEVQTGPSAIQTKGRLGTDIAWKSVSRHRIGIQCMDYAGHSV